MSETNNKYSIKGTIYDKKCDTIVGKKDPSQSYNKYLITLEVTSSEERTTKDGSKFITKTEFPQFEAFSPKFDIDSFMIGDYCEIRFYLSGQKFTYKTGVNAGKEGIMTKNSVTFMKYADLGSNQSRPSGNKIEVGSMSDARELEKVFVQPDPDEEGLSDLPF